MKKSKLISKAKRLNRDKPTLKSIRMSKGLTQGVVKITKNTAFPIPQGTISSWETGACTPNSNSLLFLAGLYQVSKNEILEAWQNTWEESDHYGNHLEDWKPIFDKAEEYYIDGDEEEQTELEFEDNE